MAEAIHAEIVGRENLTGAANYWSMVMFLRPYVFLVSFDHSCFKILNNTSIISYSVVLQYFRNAPILRFSSCPHSQILMCKLG